METEEFVQKLKESAPDRETYLGRGLSEEFINERIESFNCKIRKSSSSYHDPLLKLIDCYEANKIQIGNIDFSKNIEETSNYYIIGELEVDWLVIDKKTEIVKVVEKHIYHDMWDCAANSSAFLEALLEASNFFIKSSLDDDLYNNQEVTCAVAEVCGSIAGGDKYSDFYKMFVGCW